ncbi:MAG: TonB family protein [Roseivirga sp.]|nr:TonB family protein [Roseivirga sp.]
MSRKHNHIEQLTPELIKAYQEGSLSADEMYAVEQFLLENPFEAEALEGLEMLTTNSVDAHLDDLNARLANKLAEDHETKVIFWTMTRKIAASLLVLVTAAFLFFWQEPDITTKEITQVDNKTDQTENESALDTLELRGGDIDGNAREVVKDGNVGKKRTEEKSEEPDLDDKSAGFVNIEELQAKSEPAPSLSLEAAKEEIAEEELRDVEIIDATSLRAANTSERKERPSAVSTVFDQKAQTVTPPTSIESISINLKDTIGSNPESLEKALQGRTAGLQTEQPESLRADFNSRNQTKPDSTETLAFGMVGAGYKIKASSFTVSGVVTDDEGIPLPAVTVQIKGTSIGMLTDAKGAYSLSSATIIGSLLFRYLGYSTQEEEVKDRTVINMEMSPDVSSLGEVVVSDYAPPQPPDEEDVVKNYNPAKPVYGRRAFSKHVSENLIYPDAAAAENIRGRVLVEFTVTENGDLKNFKVLKGLGYGCDEEAIRLIKTGPRWQARKTGIDRSTPVDSKVRVRIRFKP